MMGSIQFESQYQQNPVPADGQIIKRAWLRYYEEPPEVFDFIIVSWDTASTDNDGSDFSVGTVWGRKGKHIYLLDVIRGRPEPVKLRHLIESTHVEARRTPR